MSQAILEINNVTAGYGDTEVLHDVSLTVYPAEVIGIVGQSGSGKTSLLNCVLQLEPNLEITSGEILYSNQNLLTLNKKEYRRLFQDKIAIIFQNSNFALVPTRKISSQFYETTRGRLAKKEIRKKAGMTQTVFASYMGVSKKTVEAWESGRTHPTGPAFRLLDILEAENFSKTDFVVAN